MNSPPTALETFFRISPLNNGVALPARKFVDFQGAASDDPNYLVAGQPQGRTLITAPPVPPPLWTPGGPLIWSPVDIINAIANIETSAAFITTALNISSSLPFYCMTGVRYCNGVRFVWGSGHATTVSVRLWSGMSNTGGTSIAHVTQVVGASAGVYSVPFGNNYILSNGKAYAVTVWDTDPTSSGTHYVSYTQTTGADGTTWNNLFGNAGNNNVIALAPGVFMAQIPGLGGTAPLTNYGFNGDVVPNNSGGGHGFNAVEPILQ